MKKTQPLMLLKQQVETYNTTLVQNSIIINRLFASELLAPLQIKGQMPVDGKLLPKLQAGNAVLNNDTAIVDSFTRRSHAVATVFVKTAQILSVFLLRSRKKTVAVRSVLSVHDHPAYSLLLKSESFTGRATLFGREYMTGYSPLKDASGVIIGAAFIGIDFTEGLKGLLDSMKSIKIGQTGHAWILTAKPVLVADNLSCIRIGRQKWPAIERHYRPACFPENAR